MKALGWRLAAGLAAAVGILAGVEIAAPYVLDPTPLLLGEGAQAREREEVRRELGFDRPWWQRVSAGFTTLLHPAEARSLWHRAPVAELVATRWQPTFLVLATALLTSLASGGIAAAASARVRGIRFFVHQLWTLLLAFPLFVAASILATSTAAFVEGRMHRAAVGGLLVGAYGGLWYGRVLAARIQAESRTTYALVERALGVASRRITLRRVRPLLFTALGVFELQLAWLLTGGTIVVEYSFHLEGMGALLLDSALRGDLPVLRLVLSGTLIVYLIVFNLAMEARRALDPRLKDRA